MDKNKKTNHAKIMLIKWVIIFSILFSVYVVFSLFWTKYFTFDKTNDDSEELIKWIEQIQSIDFSSWTQYTWSVITTGNEQNIINKTWFEVKGQCEIVYTGSYKVVSVFDDPVFSPTDFKNHLSYSNEFLISGHIEEAYGCIVADVVDYRKTHRFHYSTYIIFHEPKYAGHINVAYSTKNRVMYDYTSDPRHQFLDGRFRWDETPKIYRPEDLNLEKIVVADIQNGWYKEIQPLERLQQQWPIRIGWFVNAQNGEGILRKFIIIYKGEGEIIKK